MVIDKFVAKRLAQLKSIGATMGDRGYGGSLVWVSSVRFGDGVWTRATNQDHSVMRHYKGDIPTHVAARWFREEVMA